MNAKTLSLLSIMVSWTILLAWCNNQSNIEEEKTQIANPASVYCEDNWWTLELKESEWICNFDDGSSCEEWAFMRWECQKWDSLLEWETTSSGESLTESELEELENTHFPKGYTYTSFNSETNETTTWEYVYPEDLSHTLLIPIHATMASRVVKNSWIEDDMIYTLTDVTLQDDTEVSVLYIVDPETRNFVAATVDNNTESTNYQFIY